jgi:phosphoglycolate phosphatase-like HAD superfamily hydrolase
MLKLDHFDLRLHLREGGFGDDSSDRSEVVARAIGRLTGTGKMAEHGDGNTPVIVVGDTPHDVRAAHANGCLAAAVATGFSTRAELSDAGAELVLDDFADREAAFEALLQLAESRRP